MLYHLLTHCFYSNLSLVLISCALSFSLCFSRMSHHRKLCVRLFSSTCDWTSSSVFSPLHPVNAIDFLTVSPHRISFMFVSKVFRLLVFVLPDWHWQRIREVLVCATPPVDSARASDISYNKSTMTLLLTHNKTPCLIIHHRAGTGPISYLLQCNKRLVKNQYSQTISCPVSRPHS